MGLNKFHFYNSERKNRFLSEEYPNEATQQTYGSLLNQIAKFEEDKNKDLCDFNYNDAIELLIGLKKKTIKSINVAQTIISKYVAWCIKEGYNQTGINNFRLLNKGDLSKYTHQIAQKFSYITREKMYEHCDSLYNYVDKALLALLFEGVRGRTEGENTFEELRNLKKSDLYPESNVIVVTRNDGEKRSIQVDKRTMEILVASTNQMNYHKENGEARGRFAIAPLKDNDYILRTLDRSNSEGDKISISAINLKFTNIRRYTGIQFLTPTTMFQSGLIEKCEEIERESGKPMAVEDYKLIYHNLRLDDRIYFNLKEIHETYKRNKASK